MESPFKSDDNFKVEEQISYQRFITPQFHENLKTDLKDKLTYLKQKFNIASIDNK